ncbi:PAS domain-containing protein [Archangium violaceum]|uniref:sensor histidine kinase n=1 Tax=Archangium violaceum TaxID=83451 RepID=UPI0019523730|nr:PAS domain-containing protein [Archangium violaceum]QRO01440.1 PAS domain-containing protein [Archangium violaceum]
MPSVAELIEQHRENLLERFLQEASRRPSARQVSPQDLLDNLPAYLDTLCALSRGQRGEPGHTRWRMEEAHLGQRLRLGYTPEDVLAELDLLGQLLSRLWESLPPDQQPAPEDTQRLLDALQAAREHTVSVFNPPSAPLPPEVEALQLNEERLRLAVEATGLGTWDYDPTTGALLWDERCKALCGLPPDAVVENYDTFLAALHPEDRERAHQLVRQALDPAGSRTYQIDYRVVGLKDGIERWLSANGRAFFDSRGRAVRLIGTVLDITERVRAREAVEREKNRVISILESISEAFEAFDRQWRFIYVNREAERLMGQSREALLGRNHWEVYPATLGTALEHNFRRAASERISLTFENYYAPWDRWFELHIYPTDEGLAVYFHDITERKRRDEERERLLREQTRLREQAEKALRERQRAVEVLEHGEALLVLDKDFRFILVNENQERIARMRREDTLGRVFWEVFPTLTTPQSTIWREFHRVMEQKVPVQFDEYYPPMDLWVGMSAFPTSEGGLAVFFRDITEQKRAEQLRDRLVGIVSHDLRSPLQSISLASELLLRREDIPAPALTGVRRISRSAERMSRMITDLLDFTRARTGGGIPLQRRPGELVDLVRNTLEELEVTHPGRVVLSHGQGPYAGEWDLDRLAQVVTNLVSNALQHGAENTPVEVDLREDSAELVLTVTNQGTPIPQTLLPHVFDPFRRAGSGSPSARQGLGLGLYIVQQIVLAHGGSITVSSDEASGTRFTVRLPRDSTPS